MANRDMPGAGEPNRKASDPLSGSQGSQSYKDQARNELNRAQEQALDSGRETLGAAQTRIRSLLEQQTHRAADQLGSVAEALHGAADQLAKENNGTAAHYADQAASRVEQVAGILRESSLDDIVGHAERFARRQPEVFVGAAFAVGFLFSRFIKSSGDRRIRAAGYDTGAQRVRAGGYGGGDHDTGYDQAASRTGTRDFTAGSQARDAAMSEGFRSAGFKSEGFPAGRSGRVGNPATGTAGIVPDAALDSTRTPGGKPQEKLP